jgi:hypothetical protein
MKIKFLNPHPAYGYFPGETGEVNDQAAQQLIEEGYAEAVITKPPAKPKSDGK